MQLPGTTAWRLKSGARATSPGRERSNSSTDASAGSAEVREGPWRVDHDLNCAFLAGAAETPLGTHQ
jgi:hypothetical protein